MTNNTSEINHVNRIYARHADALRRIADSFDSVATDAALVSMALALGELADAMQRDNAAADAELARIERVLGAHDSALFADVASGRTGLATALDALICAENARLTQELAAARHAQSLAEAQSAQHYTDSVAATMNNIEMAATISRQRDRLFALDAENVRLAQELATRRQIATDLEFDNARLAQELATRHSWVTAPCTGSPAEEVQP